MTNYTIICQDSIAHNGFEHAETNKRRAVKYAREFVAESHRNSAQASVVIYGTRDNGARCLVRRVAKFVNFEGRAESRS